MLVLKHTRARTRAVQFRLIVPDLAPLFPVQQSSLLHILSPVFKLDFFCLVKTF